jgi:mRNA-degrading endonuclease RelE of RelBE toxin-antitoxin system
MTAKLVLHRQILRGSHKLPAIVQKRISEWIDLFQKDPHDPTVGLHSVADGMADHKVRGADLPGG